MEQQIKGLTSNEVKKRTEEGKVNQFQSESSRSVKEIVCSNIFTLFNLINVILFAMVLSVFSIKNATFMIVIVSNTVIGIVEELRAKKTLDNLKILTVEEVDVIRDGETKNCKVTDLVEGDYVILSSGKQVPADAQVVQGRMEVNESLLTGESDSVEKTVGEEILSGSFVVSGRAVCLLTKVGKDCYSEQIAKEAKTYRKNKSQLQNSINQILKVISVIIVPLGVLMFCKEYFFSGLAYKDAVLDTVASVVGMIPEGLVLLTSIALSLGVVRLARRGTLVQELYGIEMLARVDTICLDKTGTLTEGNLILSRVEPLTKGDDVRPVLARMMKELPDENETARAIRTAMDGISPMAGTVSSVIPFSSERKYSGVSFDREGTWFLGAYEFLFPEEDSKRAVSKEAKSRIDAYALSGYRVLVLAKSDQVIGEKEKPAGLTLKAIVLLTDVIRKDAAETLNYLKEQGVDIRFISGDDPDTVSAVAERAGFFIDEPPVNAQDLQTEDEIRDALKRAKIFGRVTPKQKETMVRLLQEEGHTVAMTGDGVNDVLALKRADCSIAMASGSDAAKNVSNIVLLDSNFSSVPQIVKEGRRVINNITRSASMYLVKTIFSVLLSIMTIFVGQTYPFIPIQLTVICLFSVGIPTFLIQLEPSFEKYEEGFLKKVFRNAIPTGVTISLLVFLIQNIGLLFGFSEAELTTACVLTTWFNYLIAQRQVYAPLTRYRNIVVYTMTGILLVVLMLFGKNLLEMTDLALEMVIVILIAVQVSPLINGLVRKGVDWFFHRFEERDLKKEEAK